jgi:hypothetical protein
VEKKIRGTNVQNFIEHIKSEHAIVQQHITAYEPIDKVVEKDADGTLVIHPSFKTILQHKLEQNPHFQQWYKDEFPKSGGLLNIHRLNSNYPTLREFIASFSSFSTSLGKRHASQSPRELGVHPRTEMDSASGVEVGPVKETPRELELKAELERMRLELAEFRQEYRKDQEERRKDKLDIIQATAATASTTQEMIKEATEALEEKGACEQHTLKENQELKKKNKSLEQTEKGVYTKKINKAIKERDAAIKEREDLAVQNKLLAAENTIQRRHVERLSGNGHLHDFQIMMEEFHLSKTVTKSYRGDFLPVPSTFSVDVYRRVFSVVMSVALDDVHNCSNSAPYNRFVLGRYAGPIFSKMAIDELVDANLKLITWMCNKLGVDIPTNLVGTYASISGDPFASPEVCNSVFC